MNSSSHAFREHERDCAARDDRADLAREQRQERMARALPVLVAAWTPALGDWWANDRANHVAMVLEIWDREPATRPAEGATVLDVCRSVLMSGRGCGLVFTDLDGLAQAGADAWNGVMFG